MGWVIAALLENGPKETLLPLLQRHGLEPVEPYRWYPLAGWLEALQEISETTSTDMASLGMTVISGAALPPWIDSLSSALLALEENYRAAHRNGNIGEIFARVVHGRHVRFTVSTPYPDDYIFGNAYGMAMRFLPVGCNLDITRTTGHRATTYDVRW